MSKCLLIKPHNDDCHCWGELHALHNNDTFRINCEVVTIGRSSDSNLSLNCEGISDSHCILMRDPDDKVWLFDCSENGTWFSGKYIHQDSVCLNSGDCFYLHWDDEDLTKRIGFSIKLFLKEQDHFNNLIRESPKSLIPVPSVDLLASTSTQNKVNSDTLFSDSNVESCLTCIICNEIFYECCSVQPCLHSFCTICWLRWSSQSSDCPICRTHVLVYSKNHQLNQLIELFLHKYPEKAKTDAEIKEIQKEIDQYTKPGSIRPVSGFTNRINSSFSHSVTKCIVCTWSPGSYRNTQPNECPAHDFCACCRKPIPDLRSVTVSSPNMIQCEVCGRCSCGLVNPNPCSSCAGRCLMRIQDLRLLDHLPEHFMVSNIVETEFLRQYLLTRGISVLTFINQCIDLFNPTIFPNYNLTLDSPVCNMCVAYILSQLAYHFRLSIPLDQLPCGAIGRPNCIHGSNCRTQRTNLDHARRYNHIC